MPEHESDTQQRKPKWYIEWKFEYVRTYPNIVATIKHPVIEGAIHYHRRGVLTQGTPQMIGYINEFQPVLQEQVDILNGLTVEE